MSRIALFLIPFMVWTAAPAAVLSETVGSVGGEVFTSRQALLSGLMERVLAGSRDPGAVPEGKGESLNKERSALLLEAAVARESDLFAMSSSEAAEVSSLVEKTKRHLQSRSDWRKQEYSDAEIRTAATRKIGARILIRLKSDSMRTTVTEAEAQKYFEDNRSKFGNLPFANFKDQIQKVLSQQQLDERLRSWFEILRRKYQVRDFATSEGSAPKS